jgi:hypothetical protein
VWLRQRRKVDHYFAKAGRHVTYGAEVSAVADKGRLKKITGVKAKEMLLWVTLHEICVDDPPTGKLHCKAIGGLSRSFPVEAFEAEEPAPPGAGGVVPRDTEEEEVEKEGEGDKNPEQEAAADKDGDAPATAPAAEEAESKAEEKADKEVSSADPAVVHAEALAAKN